MHPLIARNTSLLPNSRAVERVRLRLTLTRRLRGSCINMLLFQLDTDAPSGAVLS